MKAALPLAIALSIALSSSSAAGVDPVPEELSPRGKLIAQCAAFYEAMANVVREENPDVEGYSGFVGNESPKMVRWYFSSVNRSEQMKRAFPDNLLKTIIVSNPEPN